MEIVENNADTVDTSEKRQQALETVRSLFGVLDSKELFGLMVGLLNDEFKLVHTPILFIAALFWPVTITYWFYHHYIKGRNENN